LQAAEGILRRALEIQELGLGASLPDVATTWIRLVSALRRRGETEEARLLLERSLAVREASFGVRAQAWETQSTECAILVRLGTFLSTDYGQEGLSSFRPLRLSVTLVSYTSATRAP